MTDRPDHATAERTFRDLLDRGGLAQPDEVAHWRDAILFGWHDSRTVIVLDLDEFGEGPPEGFGPELFGAPEWV
jgi:hypothetical protein